MIAKKSHFVKTCAWTPRRRRDGSAASMRQLRGVDATAPRLRDHSAESTPRGGQDTCHDPGAAVAYANDTCLGMFSRCFQCRDRSGGHPLTPLACATMACFLAINLARSHQSDRSQETSRRRRPVDSRSRFRTTRREPCTTQTSKLVRSRRFDRRLARDEHSAQKSHAP